MTALALAAEGAKVALIARRGDTLTDIAEEITRSGGTALPLTVDVTDPDAVRAAAMRVQEELGGASILFNNAGIMLPAPFAGHNMADWNKQIDLNVTALVTVADAFTDQLLAAAQRDGVADLINTGSIAGESMSPGFAVYGATKAFVKHLTANLRTELGAQNVRVANIAPGIVGTELQSHVTDVGTKAWLEGAKETIDWLTPQDLAELVTFTVTRPAHVNLAHTLILPTKQTA